VSWLIKSRRRFAACAIRGQHQGGCPVRRHAHAPQINSLEHGAHIVVGTPAA